MRALVSVGARFAVTGDGVLWGSSSLCHSFWTRYLQIFDEVRLLVRAKECKEPPAGHLPATGPGVTFTALPYYEGPLQFLLRLPRIRRGIRQAVASAEAVQLRLPCFLGTQVHRALPAGRPYGVEVVGDPWDVFAPGANAHPLRPFFRRYLSRKLRRQCAGASASAYVTEHALQRRYPPAEGSFTTHFSSIDLTDEAFVAEPRSVPAESRRLRLVTVGTLAQLYKAPDVLIDAVGKCVGGGLDLDLVLVGDGKHRAELEARAAKLGLADRVVFRGALPAGEAVRKELDASDVFVLPSRQEGLPRAMIEAMARGLACIGSTIAGIPELLDPDFLVPPDDAGALAARIREVVSDAGRMAEASARNVVKAREYHKDALSPRRIALYEHVKSATEEWLRSRGRN